MNPCPRPRSRRVLPLLVALLTLAAWLPGAADSLAAGAPTSIDQSADGVQTAQRLRTLPPLNFPMQTTPRCAILDNFGDPRSNGRTHQGSDMLSTLGQEVYAMADGVLTFQGVVGDGNSGTVLSGNLWKLVANSDGTYYIYAHLSAFAEGVTKGMSVYRGQLIGYVGDTGNAGAGNYHLHFEIHPGGGAAVNPLPLITIPAGCTVF